MDIPAATAPAALEFQLDAGMTAQLRPHAGVDGGDGGALLLQLGFSESLIAWYGPGRRPRPSSLRPYLSVCALPQPAPR